MFELKTNHLRIIPLNINQLKMYRNDQRALEKSLGLNEALPAKFDPAIENELGGAWIFWINQVQKNPFTYTWFTRWEIILKSENRIIGSCGFKGAPDKNGEVEVGYMINPHYHNKGYMSEALSEMVKYAFLHYRVKGVIAETPADNYQSQKVLIKNNFVEAGTNQGNIVWRLMKESN